MFNKIYEGINLVKCSVSSTNQSVMPIEFISYAPFVVKI